MVNTWSRGGRKRGMDTKKKTTRIEILSNEEKNGTKKKWVFLLSSRLDPVLSPIVKYRSQ